MKSEPRNSNVVAHFWAPPYRDADYCARCNERREHPLHLTPGDVDARNEAIKQTCDLAKAV